MRCGGGCYNGGGSWRLWMLMQSELEEVVEVVEGWEVQGEEQVEAEQQAVCPNAGPYSLG